MSLVSSEPSRINHRIVGFAGGRLVGGAVEPRRMVRGGILVGPRKIATNSGGLGLGLTKGLGWS